MIVRRLFACHAGDIFGVVVELNARKFFHDAGPFPTDIAGSVEPNTRLDVRLRALVGEFAEIIAQGIQEACTIIAPEFRLADSGRLHAVHSAASSGIEARGFATGESGHRANINAGDRFGGRQIHDRGDVLGAVALGRFGVEPGDD